ncbi:MAG: hypothetical protein AB7O59_23630 [Pirellulales bacterium]
MIRTDRFAGFQARCLFFALAAWTCATAFAQAASDPLTVIPGDALGVVVLNNLADTSARVQRVTQKMQLPVPELLPMAQLYTGAQQGVDAQGSLAAAMFPPGEDESWTAMIAVFVPVTDYKAFIAQLQPDDASAEICEVTVMGQTFLCLHKAPFAVLAGSDSKALLERIKAAQQNIAEVLKPARSWLDQQQLAVMLTPAGKKLVLEKAGEFMSSLSTAIAPPSETEEGDQPNADDAGATSAKTSADDDDASKDDADDAAARRQAEALESSRETMRSLQQLIAAANEQFTHLGIGLRIDDSTAVHLSARCIFAVDGGLSRWAADVRRPDGGVLKGLPPGKFTLAYGGAAVQFHPAFAEMINRMTQTGMMALGLGEEDRRQLAAIMDRHRANQTSTSAVLAALRPGDSVVSNTVQLEHVQDAAKQMQTSRELYELLAKASVPGQDPPKQLYSVSDATVGELKTIEFTMDMNALMEAQAQDAPADATQAMRGIFAKILGGDGVMRAYVTVADDHTLVMAYSKEQLQRAVDQVRGGKPGLEADEQIARTDNLLPQGAQWAAYVSPQGLVSLIDVLLKELAGELGFRIPPFPPSDPIGLAAKVSPAGLDAELVLPESVVAGIGQYIGLIQQMMTPGDAPLP